MKDEKMEFTLGQLFFAIIIIGVVLCLIAYGVSNLINGLDGSVSINSIEKAAMTYASESSSDNWEEIKDYDVYCVTVGELVNKGFLENTIFTNSSVSRSDLVIVKRNNGSLEIKEARITKKNDDDYKICKNILPEVKYTVTFHKSDNVSSIDGSITDTLKKECTALGSESCIIKAPNIKVGVGYSVVGWNSDKNATTSSFDIDTEKIINSNIDYYAITKANVLSIKYSVNGGFILTTSNSEGTWKKDSNDIILLNDKTLVTSIFYNDSLDNYGLEDYNNENRINIDKTGYYVQSGEEWKCMSGCNGTFSQSKVYSAKDFCNIDVNDCDVVLGVNWKSSYTIKYNANGGSGAPDNQIKYPDKNLVLSKVKPTRSGYTFKNWNTKQDGSGTSYNAGASYTNNANVTLYAQWYLNSSSGEIDPPTTYTVKYNANGGSGEPDNQVKIHGEPLILSTVKPTRSGYTFKNWNTKKDGSGTSYSTGTTYGGNANITLYAQWSLNSSSGEIDPPTTYTIKYNANGGSGAPSTQNKTSGCIYISNTVPSRSGYTFENWNTSSNGNGISYEAGDYYCDDANLTLYAQWTLNSYVEPPSTTYTITYNANGGSGGVSTQNKTSGCIYLNSTVPSRSGYTFKNWNTSPNGNGTSYEAGGYYCVDANVTLYAQWTLNPPTTYKIIYDANGGSGAPSTQDKTSSCIYLSSTVPVRSGYTFKNWNTSPNGNGTTYGSGGYYCGDANLTLYAQWTSNSSGGSGGGITPSHTHVVNAIGNTLRTVSRIKLSCGHYHTTVLYRYCSICGMSAYNISGEGMYACPCGPSYTYIFNDSVIGSYSAYKSWLGTTVSPSYQLYTTSSFTRDCSGH